MSDTVDDDAVTDLGDDAANAFLENLTGETIPVDDDAAPAPVTGDDDTSDEPADTDDEGDDAPDKPPASDDPDDAEVDLKVGDTTTKATLRDLKAAYMRANEVDARHVEVSTRLAATVASQARADAVLERAMTRAEEKWAPYAKLDFLALSRDASIDSETFAALRQEALAAQNEVSFLRQEVDGQVKSRQETISAASRAEATATVKALEHPDTGIKGWSPAVYQTLIDYAQTVGVPSTVARSMTSEWGVRLLHKAMLFDKGTASTAQKIAKVIAKPVRTLSPGNAASAPAASTARSAMARLKASGTAEDAGDAFFASFGVED